MYTFPIHQSLSSFLLIVLLFFTPASSAPEDNQQFRHCLPTLFDCGGVLLNISYPFWTEYSPDYCRSPQELEMEMKIQCDRTYNFPEIVLQKRPYHVIKIDYEDKKATIVDEDYYLANEDKISCLAPSDNTSLDFNLFNYTGGNFNFSFLYKCPDHLCWDCFNSNGHCGFRETFPLKRACNCNGTSYPDECPPPRPVSPPPGLFTDCKVIRIPILETNREKLEAWTLDFKNWNDILKEGFEVTWSLIDPYHQCWDCVKSNGHCGLNKTSLHEFACYCNGIPHPETCPLPQYPVPAPGKHLFYLLVSPGSSSSSFSYIKDDFFVYGRWCLIYQMDPAICLELGPFWVSIND